MKIFNRYSLLLLLIGSSSLCWDSTGGIGFHPEEGVYVREGDFADFNVSLIENNTAVIKAVGFTVESPFNLRIVNETVFRAPYPDFPLIQPKLEGLFVGYSDLTVNVSYVDGTFDVFSYKVAILRTLTSGQLSNIFTVFVAIVVFLNNIVMGIQLDPKIIWEIFKKPISPVIGIFCQWGLMAPLAAGWGMLLLKDAGQQLGYFCVGCSPGGGPSNKFTLLLDGNLNLSITLTFLSNILALGFMPMWIYTLGKVFTSRAGIGGKSLEIPFTSILSSLATMLIPSLIGMAISHFRPTWRQKSRTAVKVSSFLIMLMIIPFGIVVNFYIFSLFTWRTVLAGLTLPYSGFILAVLLGFIARRDWADQLTLGIETAIQNAQIGILLVRFALPEPANDLALVMPICCLIFTPLPLWVGILFRSIRGCIRRRRGLEPEADVKKPPGKNEGEDEEKDIKPIKALVGLIKKRIGKGRRPSTKVNDSSATAAAAVPMKPTAPNAPPPDVEYSSNGKRPGNRGGGGGGEKDLSDSSGHNGFSYKNGGDGGETGGLNGNPYSSTPHQQDNGVRHHVQNNGIIHGGGSRHDNRRQNDDNRENDRRPNGAVGKYENRNSYGDDADENIGMDGIKIDGDSISLKV